MNTAELLLYLVLIPLSAFATYAMRRDVVPISAAVLTAFYASIGNASLSTVSALTIVFYSLVRISLARPIKEKKVVLMKLRYIFTVSIVLISSILVAYIALGSAISMLPLESHVLAVAIVALMYLLMSIAIVPKLVSITSPRLWQAIKVDLVEDFLWNLGVVLGGITMFINTVVHGALGLILMLAYVVAFIATQRRRLPVPGIAISVIAGIGAVITYLAGYT
ncbi:MAG: hypothetical protein QXG17_01800 [Sulfolobales archaeon]